MNAQSQITGYLFSEFIRLGKSNGFDDFYVGMENKCLVFQSYHKEKPFTQICIIPENEIYNLREYADYMAKNTRTSNLDGN